ncbi:hypothetical protein F511_13408 [Dorcoceras hygrometricum]|uniref:Uncharacterized protein n=1 Tax=Dorcoceras hygrometricum TaxID=472368 RepID=A0A2Z7DHM5_9LAMI|nr:hypothetical protein F511_13408 [Dorcoceras hygrometricum]
MASFVNAMQVNLDSALTMQHSVMVKMFKSLDNSGLKGFLETSKSVYEEVVIEFFTNANVTAGTIVSLLGTRKMATTKDMFTETFGLPSEGLTSFLNIPKETEMRSKLSGSDEPFKAPNKKKEMNIEFRLLHDVVAKALCTKYGSFDQVTSENLEMMIAISAGMKVLTSKSVRTYIKKNMEIKPVGESSKHNEDIASNTDGGESQGAQPAKRAKATTKKKLMTAEEPRKKKQKLAVGPQPLWLRKHNFGLAHRIMIKRLATSPHDPLGITDSACKNQLVVVSVQYGPFNPYIPIRSTTIGKSRVAIDPIAMHTSWRSNSDIASVTRVSMTFRVVRTNQYNQDLGIIHSTNGNHLESPNEGSSIYHQVKLQLAELVEHQKRIGNDKKGERGQSRPWEGLNIPGEEGSSDVHSIIRGIGPSLRGGRGGPNSRGGRGSSPGSNDPSDPSNRYRYNKRF